MTEAKDTRRLVVESGGLDGGAFVGLLFYLFAVRGAGVWLVGYGGPSASPVVATMNLLLTVPVLVWCIVFTGFWGEWAFWRPAPERDRVTLVLMGVLAFVGLTEVTVAATTWWYDLGGLGRGGDFPNTVGGFGSEGLWGTLEQTFLWHAADMVPALKVPETLDWRRPEPLGDARASALVPAYKILVILPFIGLAVRFLQRPDRIAEPVGRF